MNNSVSPFLFFLLLKKSRNTNQYREVTGTKISMRSQQILAGTNHAEKVYLFLGHPVH